MVVPNRLRNANFVFVFYLVEEDQLGPPVVPFYPFLGEGCPTKIDYRKKVGTLILAAIVEDRASGWDKSSKAAPRVENRPPNPNPARGAEELHGLRDLRGLGLQARGSAKRAAGGFGWYLADLFFPGAVGGFWTGVGVVACFLFVNLWCCLAISLCIFLSPSIGIRLQQT